MGLYLDYNASAPMLNSSIDAMVESMKLIGNPSSIHSSGRRAKNAIEDSRELVAETIDISLKILYLPLEPQNQTL